jgi:drug/metabolite transporter (DMT)-like permease
LIVPDKRPLGILYASITALFWGFLPILLKIAVNFIGPATIVWIRFLTAFSILFIIFIVYDPRYLKILKRPPFLLLIASVCLGLNYIGFMQGVHYTSPGITQIIIQLGPVLLALVGVLIYKERLSPRQMLGFVVAGIGFMIFYYNQLTHFLKDQKTFHAGVLFIVLGAISWVIFASIQKKFVQKFPTQQLNLVIYGIPVFMFFPFVEFSQFEGLNISQWTLLIFLGINTLIAYGSLAAALKYIEANKVSIIITLNPIITFVAMFVLDLLDVAWIEPENINFYGFIGAGGVLAGVILAVRKPGRKKTPPEAK